MLGQAARREISQWRKDAATNEHWPLPADYPTLTEEGRRLARIALVSDHSTPARLVLAWSSFCHFYLRPESARFYRRWKPPAKMHYCMVHDIGRYPRSMITFPRGAGKSTTLLRTLPLLFAYTRPGMTVWCVTSKIDLWTFAMDDIKMQIEQNEILRADFGDFKPRRGSGVWSATRLRLANRFRLVGQPIGGKNLGGRPDLLLLDDVEHDPEDESAGPRLTEQLERKMFYVYRPMMEEGTTIALIGTVRRHSAFLYRAMHSKDPRLNYWNRRNLEIVDSKGRSIWPEKWPVHVINQLREEMGDAFGSEYMNNPMLSKTRTFAFNRRYHSYARTNPDSLWLTDPLSSTTQFARALRPATADAPPTYRVYTAKDFLPNCFRFITADYAHTVSYTSDFQCAACMALDSESNLWLLDLFLARCPRDEFINAILRMALRFQVRLIAPESVSVQEQLTDTLIRVLEAPCLSLMGYIPAVIHLKGKAFQAKKGERVSTLQWRFERDKIFLPANDLDVWPFNELVNQINIFAGDTDAMRHDDAIDALSMSTEVLKLRRVSNPEETPVPSVMQQLLDDPIRNLLGIPALSGYDISQLTAEDAAALRSHSPDRRLPNHSRIRPDRKSVV